MDALFLGGFMGKDGRREILLYNADPRVAQELKAEFEKHGFFVRIADTDEQLVGMFARYSPDVLVTDWLFGEFDFREIFENIQGMDPRRKVEIVVHAGDGHLDVARNFCSKEKLRFVPAPVAIDLVLKTIQRNVSAQEHCAK